jgi:hypothetical protein
MRYSAVYLHTTDLRAFSGVFFTHDLMTPGWDSGSCPPPPMCAAIRYGHNNPLDDIALSRHHITSLRTSLVLTCRARLHHPSPISPPLPLNLTLYTRGQGGHLSEQITTSGPYSDAVSGVRIPRKRLEKGVYVLVPSGFERGGGRGRNWKVDVWCDSPISTERVR